MKNVLRTFMVIFFLTSSGCQIKKEPSVDSEVKAAELAEVEPNFTEEQIAIFTISAIMGQDPLTISATKRGETYLVSYKRESDGQFFDYKVKFFGNNKVVWGANDGRWRDTKYDERIQYYERENKLVIKQIFSDDSNS
jgi:hypothetical protein